MTGLFVVFEGGDGVGKSTQCRLLEQWARQRGLPARLTFEPGDTAAGQMIRRIVLDPATGDLDPRAEALLYAADKAHHLHEVVRPALLRGELVICDRYVDSMLAYQGAGRVLDLAEVTEIARWATDGLLPDLTVLLDLEPERAVGTIAEPDRLEGAGAEFHDRARRLFLQLAARDAGRYLVLPARESPEWIAGRVQRRVKELIAERAELSAAAGRIQP
ncbi:MAG: dTMP kinase [Micropruina sp.]|uniref:dTMP kinase n=1 Tax=Micropruina sp. TaxID=2737536 RepID=UPI0039E2A5AE